ncbi:hypothetical protein FACS1894189_7470 [Planctomycetales bacterium]|nr:hypothetical protein FACS1894189_7470 [Planctomycetales bacterium]
MPTNETKPFDGVEMVRAIRQRHYEETKDMSREERREHDRKKVAEFEQYRKMVNPVQVTERIADVNE